MRRTVEVRRAEPDDAHLLLDLESRARHDAEVERPLAQTAIGTGQARLEEALGRADVEVHVAFLDGRPAGAAVVRLGDLLALGRGPAVRVDVLYVAPDCRRRGIARALLGAVVTVAERTGAEEVSCSVPSGGRDAHRFLARLGFSRLITLRATPVARLRSKLAGEHEGGRRRVALDALVARRRRQLDRPLTPPGGLRAVPPVQAGRPPLSAAGRRAAGR